MSAAERARLAWLTASRDTELDRWRDLYDAVVPRPAGCPAAPACESCGAAAGLSVEEADTPIGVICLTLCDPCVDAGRTPALTVSAANRRALAHMEHVPGLAGVAR